MNKLELAWLAGILEGEGSFSKCSSGKQPRVSMGSVDEDVIQTVAKMLNANICRTTSGGRPFFSVEISGAKARVIMRAIYPYMHTRRKGRIRELLIAAEIPE